MTFSLVRKLKYQYFNFQESTCKGRLISFLKIMTSLLGVFEYKKFSSKINRIVGVKISVILEILKLVPGAYLEFRKFLCSLRVVSHPSNVTYLIKIVDM